jgi:hypothetical protein
MARQTLGDFHINLQSPMSHIQQSQFQQGIIQEIIHQFGPAQIVLLEPPGEIGSPKRRELAMCVCLLASGYEGGCYKACDTNC